VSDVAVAPQRFRLLRRLGEGAMGVVHEALDTDRNERVAVKVLRSTSADSLVRFKREFRALQDLHHPNLVTLGELISERDRWFFTMELVNGDDFVSYVTPARGASRSSSSLRLLEEEGNGPATRPVPDAHVAGPPPFDEARVRAALVQLAHGLVALHDAGKVHRDIKPSNILVTPEGRLVILDFGLVTELQTDAFSLSGTDLDVVGTPAYMAPEQAASKAVGPAADWYAVGVLLYEALTGNVPFGGAALQILLRKQKDEPPSPRTISPEVPADLDALCTQMLRFDPAARPTGRQVLRALNAPMTGRLTQQSIQSMTAGATFVGREAELSVLNKAYSDAREGHAVTVFVSGESGIGKSCLVKYFTDANAMQDRNLVVLAGRCYEREAVPFKAFDGVVDALSRFLARLPSGEATRFLPTRPASLVQLFPVLRRVESIARAQRTSTGVMDPHELRSRAFSAMRELFARLVDHRSVVLVIDDMQWADADSLALLAEILRPPEAPNLLLVATTRDASLDMLEIARVTSALRSMLPGDVRHVHVDRLPVEQSRELAQRLLERAAPDLPVSAEAIANEAEGHPLFIDELVRHLLLSGAPTSGGFSLEDALWSRIQALDDLPRRLVEITAVASAPLPQDIATKALDVSGNEFARLASFLRVAHLVRTMGARGSDTIEPYHGRIRHAVVAHLNTATRRAHHHRIAMALETSASPDAESLAIHWNAAGDVDNASKYMLAAAENASQGLAFDRAAQLYQRALELRARSTVRSTRDDERALERKLGDALSNAGRGAMAANAYRAAALDANATDGLDLERRAAEQLLRSGHFDDGLDATKTVLLRVGMRLPESSVWVLVELVFWRTILALRGYGYRECDPSHVAARELTRIDIIWSVAFALALVDVKRGQLFQTRNLLFSLRVGETYRVSRALSIEASYAGTRGGKGWRRTSELLKKSDALAHKLGDPHAIAWSKACATAALYLNGKFRESLRLCDEAQAMYREEAAGNAWEVSTMQLFALKSLANLGEMKELCRRAPAALREALDRGDLYAAVNLRIGYPNFYWLVLGDPEGARREVTDAMGQWSKKGFHLEHYYELVALTNADLYSGEAARAHRRVLDCGSALRRSLLTLVQSVRIHVAAMRGRTALAHAETSEAMRGSLLASAAKDARRIERERMPWSAGCATLLRAGVANMRGRNAEALALLSSAVEQFIGADMALHAAVTRMRLSGLQVRTAPRQAEANRRAALAWMTAQSVKDPDRIAATIAPGLAVHYDAGGMGPGPTR
jgi:tetratricopeptide (TPR) repeat protein